MQHLQIAFLLGVMMIGFAALVTAVIWALRAREAYLRDFCIVYSLFTLLLGTGVLKKYLSLNVSDYSASAWYVISGVHQVVNFAMIVSAIFFLLGVFHVQSRKLIGSVFLVLMVACDILIFSPYGVVLNSENNTIQLGIGYQIATGWFLASFTFALILGIALIRRVWRTDKQTFVLGLLLFAAVGYVESFISFTNVLHNPIIARSAERNFLFSSIPYALYGVFVIVYFLRFYASPPNGTDEPSEAFITKYAITAREREVILKVIQGESNTDIASELVISLATVKTHLHNIYTKTGVDSRFDLLARVRSEK
jgi:DNA-binding NarL/FixJ family response regulator